MKNYLLPEKLQKDLIAFLSQYSFREVANIISTLSQLKYEAQDAPQETIPPGNEPKG